MKLILYPPDLPKHFACTTKRNWLVKRSEVGEDGYRLYTIENWGAASTVLYRAKFFLQFVEKMEELLGVDEVRLYQNFGGKLLRICSEYHTRREDTRTYDEFLRQAA